MTTTFNTVLTIYSFLCYSQYYVICQADSIEETLKDGLDSATWPDGIVPYAIDPHFEGYETRRILDAITTLNLQQICVHFTNKTDQDINYINIKPSETLECSFDYIGYANDGAQNLMLAPGCFTTRYVYLALLQILGLPAEHQRPDRNHLVTVYWENVDPTKLDDFKIFAYIDQRLLAIDYDYQSILHFSSDQFTTKRGTRTIVAKDNPARSLGNFLSPTALDYRKVAALYCTEPQAATTMESDDETTVEPTNVRTTKTIAKTITTAGFRRSSSRLIMPAFLPASTNPTLTTVKRPSPVLVPLPGAACVCLDQPNENGECIDSAGFQFKGMFENCRQPNAQLICRCEDPILNPCWCEAISEKCVKKCRKNDR